MLGEQCHCTNCGATYSIKGFRCDQIAHVCATDSLTHWNGGEGAIKRVPRKQPKIKNVDCRHRGKVVRTEACQTCSSVVKLKVFQCSIHEECALAEVGGVRRCRDCEDFTRYPAVDTRHLIYHVYAALKNDHWRDNVERLRDHLPLFNGRRIIAIASDDTTEPPELVERELPGCEYLRLTNDPKLRETASLLPLLETVKDVEGAVFYAHTKGNTTKDNPDGARYWRNTMYFQLLGQWEHCIELLQTYAAVGTTKLVWDNRKNPFHYPSGLSHGEWMFAGTFFWFRADVVFSKPSWSDIVLDRYGTESYLAGVLESDLAHSVYQPWPENVFPVGSPYDPQYYPQFAGQLR